MTAAVPSHKRCPRCRRVRPASAFYKRRGGHLSSYCQDCHQVASGPIMSPGYVCWHPRVLDHQVGYGEDPDPGRVVLKVALATSLPMWLGSPWWSLTTYLGRDWSE